MFKCVALVGATGAVGRIMRQLLETRNLPVERYRFLASARSAGNTITFRGTPIVVEELTNDAFAGCDLVIATTPDDIAEQYLPAAVAAGATVIDESGFWRMHEHVPLVIPEINPQEALKIKAGIIASPNCSTSVALMGLYPLHKAFGLKRVIFATYQSVSGTGADAIDELEAQVQAYAKGQPLIHKVYPYQIAFNLIPQVDSFGADGYTGEESKMREESRKIMGLPALKVSATCVRVPVVRAHSVAVNAEFEMPVDIAAARAAIAAFAGATLVDDIANKIYPTPLDFSRQVKCGVGRIRLDTALDNGLSFWVSGDNLWKGAALNSIQIAEAMIREGISLRAS